MSFLKISDPKKRDVIVNEFLKTKRNIQENFLTERLGDISTQRELTKLFKPITETQKNVKESLLGELKPIRENLKEMPAAITFPPLQAIAAPPEDEDLDTSGLYIGEIAERYLRQFVSKQEVDKTFGLYNKDGKFYIGDSSIEINDDNITVKGKEYQGTPGLWELLVMRDPDENVYTDEDKSNYAEILDKTSAMKHGNNPKSRKPKSSRGFKYKTIIKPIWENLYGYIGKGIKSVVIPSDPNALLDRLDLLLASNAAGNTGVRNELVSICDELMRQKVMNKTFYKNLMRYII